MVTDKCPNGLIGPIGLNPNRHNRLIDPNRPIRPNKKKKIGAPEKEAPKRIGLYYFSD